MRMSDWSSDVCSSDLPDWLQTMAAFVGHGQPFYMVLYIALIVFFTFFYTSIVFNPADTADNLKKYGGFIPGIRPGKKDRKSVVSGKSVSVRVDLGGRSIIK